MRGARPRPRPLSRRAAGAGAPRAMDLLALAAFHGEIARIPQTVREPAVGDIRLQWWRDALGCRVETSPAILSPMRCAPRARARPAARYARCDHRRLRARAGGRHPDDSGGASKRTSPRRTARRSTSPRVSSAQPPASADPLLHAAGQAWGRVQLLRALPLLASRGAIRSVTPKWPRLRRRRCCGKPRAELATARQRVTAAPATIRPAMLPLALVEPYLKALEGLGPDVAKRAGRNSRRSPALGDC